MNSIFNRRIDDHVSVFKKLASLEPVFLEAVHACVECINNGGKLLFAGNGGSASDCQHIVAEFVGRFSSERIALPAISFTCDTSILTCISNDYSYEYVFSRQIEALANSNDCLVLISTSGNSKNIINAAISARKLGLDVICFSGKDGGILKSHVDFPIIIPSYSTARIQESHIFLGHLLCEYVEMNLGLLND